MLRHDTDPFLVQRVVDLPKAQRHDELQVDNLVPNRDIHETELMFVLSYQETLHERALNPYSERQTGEEGDTLL